MSFRKDKTYTYRILFNIEFTAGNILLLNSQCRERVKPYLQNCFGDHLYLYNNVVLAVTMPI